MRSGPFLAAAAVAILAAGCTPAPPSLPSAQPSASVAASVPASPPASVASTPAKPSPSATKPGIPDDVGALDVGAYTVSMFASPSGAIWCALQADAAWCHFPNGFKGKVPTTEEICPDEGLDVTGIGVDTKVAYFCSGDPTAFPALNNAGEGLEWFPASGFPTVKKDGFTLATLPYGKKLLAGSFVCLSQTSGVTCGDMATGKGFTMAKAGVTIFG